MDPSSQYARLFVYGSLLPGERDHEYLAGSELLGPARTGSGFRLVDLGVFPALIESGDSHVVGELYQVDKMLLIKLDGVKELGRLFHRRAIVLESGQDAQVYLMHEGQVRGRRRLQVSSWKERFSAPSSSRRSFSH